MQQEFKKDWKFWLFEWPWLWLKLVTWPAMEYLYEDFWQFRAFVTLVVSTLIVLVLWVFQNLSAWANHDQPTVSFWKFWLVAAIVYTLRTSKVSQLKKVVKSVAVMVLYAAATICTASLAVPAVLSYLFVAVFFFKKRAKANDAIWAAVSTPFNLASKFQRFAAGGA